MDYVQITETERTEMLDTIGIESVDELFAAIPERCRLVGDLDLPPAASELDLQRELQAMADENASSATHACFMGGGAYDHFIPVLIDQLISRGEFLTAYTPYQAEASQGSLQAFFEFQTQVARLTGLEIANSSLYDGASAMAEAAILALNSTGKRRIVIADTVHPDYRKVLETVVGALPAVEIVEVAASSNGTVEPSAIGEAMAGDTACVIVQSPNFYGLVEDWTGCFETAKSEAKTLAVAVFNPIACALLKKPGECGADIAVGEGQPLGTPLQFGGPYLGLFAATKKLLRKMPGRLVGRTTDADGRPAYCLVLQTREQHIRRAKATSNICTNQGLLALRATMFMNALGPAGMREMAEQSWHKAHYAAGEIAKLNGFESKYGAEGANFFAEFVINCPCPAAEIIAAGMDCDLLLGPALDAAETGARDESMGSGNELLICVTEKRTREEIDDLVGFLSGFATG